MTNAGTVVPVLLFFFFFLFDNKPYGTELLTTNQLLAPRNRP